MRKQIWQSIFKYFISFVVELNVFIWRRHVVIVLWRRTKTIQSQSISSGWSAFFGIYNNFRVVIIHWISRRYNELAPNTECHSCRLRKSACHGLKAAICCPLTCEILPSVFWLEKNTMTLETSFSNHIPLETIKEKNWSRNVSILWSYFPLQSLIKLVHVRNSFFKMKVREKLRSLNKRTTFCSSNVVIMFHCLVCIHTSPLCV